MRLSHPGVWVVMVALGAIFVLLFGVLRAVAAIRQALRRSGWSAEQRVRSSWPRVEARVVRTTRVTDDGAFILVIELPDAPSAGGDNRYAPPSARVLRRVDHVGALLAPLIEAAETLPVRVGPAGTEVVVLDVEDLVARAEGGALDGGALALEDYARLGRWKWKPEARPAS